MPISETVPFHQALKKKWKKQFGLVDGEQIPLWILSTGKYP
jgi:hypothetical protein